MKWCAPPAISSAVGAAGRRIVLALLGVARLRIREAIQASAAEGRSRALKPWPSIHAYPAIKGRNSQHGQYHDGNLCQPHTYHPRSNAARHHRIPSNFGALAADYFSGLFRFLLAGWHLDL